MSERPRLILHVGAHKTGTSLIQKYFRDNEGQSDWSGIVAISRPTAGEVIGWGVADNPGPLADLLARTAAENPGKAIVISNENSLGKPFRNDSPGLYPHAQASIAGLVAAAEGFDLRVVFYVRPLADYIESAYLQTVHQGRHHTFTQWWETYVHGPGIEWAPTIHALDEIAGRDRVRIGDFQEMKLGPLPFLYGFLARSGLTVKGEITYERVRNPSVSARGLAMALDVNDLLVDNRERDAMRKFLQGNFSNVQFDRARPLPEEVRAELEQRDTAELRERLRQDTPPSMAGVADDAG